MIVVVVLGMEGHDLYSVLQLNSASKSMSVYRDMIALSFD